MSTILKALRRLEEEKAANEEPRPLREQIARAPEAFRARRTGWAAAAIALVLGIGAGGAVIWWLFGGESAKTRVVATAPTPAPPAAAPTVPAPAPAVPERAPMLGPPDQAFASDVEIIERPGALPRLADADPVQPAPMESPLGAQRPVESSAAAERARQAALAEYQAAERARRELPPEAVPPSPPQPAEPVPAVPAQPAVAQAAPVAPSARGPEPAPAPAPPSHVAPAPAPVAQAPVPPPAPAPKVAEVKPVPKPAPKPDAPRAAPKPEAPPPPPAPQVAVSVEKTQWHPLADRRIAWVRVPGKADSQRVVEGDVVDGFLVSAIEPSGVVFERDGEKIRRGLGK